MTRGDMADLRRRINEPASRTAELCNGKDKPNVPVVPDIVPRFGTTRVKTNSSAIHRFDPCFVRVDAHPHRITDDAQGDPAGDEPLPVFEPARVVTNDVGDGVDPGAGLKIRSGGSIRASALSNHQRQIELSCYCRLGERPIDAWVLTRYGWARF